MKSYKELMVPEDAWGEIQSLVSEAANPVTIVSCSIDDGRKTLEHLQVTNRSYLGAIALECGLPNDTRRSGLLHLPLPMDGRRAKY
ncbi:DUF2625 family protein [Paenibacillus algorifonticola]|uniref:DUF2625 family protein n=1 Tax=Paenibacillus algorifonticola TaxID=684063 RepID=UPI003D2A36F9